MTLYTLARSLGSARWQALECLSLSQLSHLMHLFCPRPRKCKPCAVYAGKPVQSFGLRPKTPRLHWLRSGRQGSLRPDANPIAPSQRGAPTNMVLMTAVKNRVATLQEVSTARMAGFTMDVNSTTAGASAKQDQQGIAPLVDVLRKNREKTLRLMISPCFKCMANPEHRRLEDLEPESDTL